MQILSHKKGIKFIRLAKFKPKIAYFPPFYVQNNAFSTYLSTFFEDF